VLELELMDSAFGTRTATSLTAISLMVNSVTSAVGFLLFLFRPVGFERGLN